VLRQAPGGVELFHHDAKVLLDRSLGLVALSGSLHPAARADLPGIPQRFHLGRAEALARAFEDLQGISVPASSFGNEQRASGGYHTFDISPGPALLAGKLQLSRPARVKEVFFPLPDRIVAAYYIEILAGPLDGTDADGHAWVISAEDGRLLYRAHLVQAEAYKYRVWAETGGNKRPLDGPIADWSPSPSGVPDDKLPPFIAPNLVSMEGFNHNPGKQADAWLFFGATETSGNNVDAYTDHASPDGYSNGDLRATTTSPLTFDRVYDVTKDPLASPEQSMAAVTQLFFTTNWLHDYWYDSGFDEAAGNAQQYNGGRGGLEGDALHAEAQDGVLEGSINNANMYTPADGDSPRMQMYIWSGLQQRTVSVPPVGNALATAGADFGAGNFDVAGEVILADDGVVPTTDACEPIVNDVSGKVALVHRGTCSFKTKAVNAQAAGAIAVLLANNKPGQAPFPAGDDPDVKGEVTIPVLPITLEDGAAIEAALGNGPVNAMLHGTQGPHPDGTIDNPIIAHEWGHYLHHRLVACDTTSQCNGQSEGWGDFLSLSLMVRAGDDLDGAYSSSIYAELGTQSPVYYGGRRVPYSTDFTKNNYTFKHISDEEALPVGVPQLDIGNSNSEVHNTGEIWTNMLFEGYVGLLKKSKGANAPYNFEAARRRMADYVVAGMKLTPPEPTFNEQRDALLAAAFATDPDDMLILAQGFAKRGLGSCAVSPEKGTSDNSGVVESFVLAPAAQILAVTLDDSVLSCDNDGRLDAEETGKVTVEIANSGVTPLLGAMLSLAGSAPGLTLLSPPTFALDPLAPFATTKVTFDVRLEASASKTLPLPFKVTLTTPTACVASLERTDTFRGNYDNAAASSATDSFDSDSDAWTPGGDAAKAVWRKAPSSPTTPLDFAWYGADAASTSDTWLTSPELVVSSTEGLVLTFEHRYSFEASPQNEGDPDTYWDGGLIEISINQGKTWKDINLFADPGYGGILYADAGNPLGNRMAFVGKSASWPKTNKVTVDLGKKLSGMSILLRFRIGTDGLLGAEGWEIDNVAVAGLSNTPFPTVVNDEKACNRPPVAFAGPDRTVQSSTPVLLDGSKSQDPDGDALTFTWTQIAGPKVELSSAGDKAIFTAPAVAVDAEVELTFELAASDGQLAAKDQVTILVRSSAKEPVDQPSTDLVGSGGCTCETTGHDGGSPAIPALLAGALLLIGQRRRRIRAPRG
ncbi:MAG: M36 family metallopeptidase, partial [Minicystis sp.]